VTRQFPAYEGFVSETTALVGTIRKVTVVPSRGNKVASTESAPKSWWNSNCKVPSFSPPMRVTAPVPKGVVVKSSAVSSNVQEARLLVRSSPAIVIT